MAQLKGRFVVLEGPDGSGKTTQIEKLKMYLEEKDVPYIATRDPGGTSSGEKIREIILKEDISSKTEVFLYAASRAELVSKVIMPALSKGSLVVSDRFLLSSLAYQGLGRGHGIENVYEINKLALGNIFPDVTFFLDLDPSLAIERKKNQKVLDRLEKENISFHKRVYKGYKESIKLFKKNIFEIDARLNEDEIFNIIKNQLKNLEVIR